MAPSFDSGLSWVSVSEETPYGKAGIDWQILGEFAAVHVEVPVNTHAVIELPGMEQEIAGSGRHDYLIQLK